MIHLTERLSENPNTTTSLNLDNYVTKDEFDCEISKRDNEIISLKSRLHPSEVNLSLTQAVVHAIQEKLAALSSPPVQSEKDNTTEGDEEDSRKR